jgi:subtilase family serine protease
VQNLATVAALPSIPFNGSQLISLYNIPIVTKTSSRQVKIAIIVAYHHPNLKTDLTMYWQSIVNFGPMSTPPTINVYTFPGATTNNSWNLEECLDTQMVATVNPNASIWVVEAKSERITDINNAIQYATTTLNADVISCSWGDVESSMLNNSNTLFINPANSANNKCFCASSGDSNKVLWPAVLSNVIAVGGTTLLWVPSASNPNNRLETTWPSTGCGYSSVATPSYQNGVNKTSKRAIPDISLVANPTNGINIVYNGAWVTIGGTSLACPIFAGVLSLANQQRFNLGKNPLTTVYTQTPSTNAVPSSIPSTNVHQFLYKTIYNNSSLMTSCFNDITLGKDGIYSAGVGYDIATGLGSPNVKNLCNAFATL